MEGEVFKGASPSVIKNAPEVAGLKPLDEEMPNRPIKALFKNPKARNHAEEMVINKFELKVDKIYPNPENVKGKFYLHQSNPSGVCTKCFSGIVNPESKEGILMRFSKRYPNLEIVVTSETDEKAKVTGRLFFVLKNGKLIDE